jgi:hypothetical protein
MIMRKISKYSVCFFVALFLLSCSNDELETNQETVKDVKSKLELAKFSNPNIAQNVEADFENANEIEKDNFKISEFSAKEKVVNYFESDLLQNQLKYQGVTIENDGKTHSYFLEVYTFKKSATYPESITKFKDFSGGLNVYSFEGENLGSVGVINGKAKNISGKEELDILTEAINLFYVPSDITSKIPLCDATYTQTVWLTQDVWRIISNGPKILEVIYVGEKVTKSTTILPYPCDGSGDVEAIKLQRMAHYSHYSENGQYIGESSIPESALADYYILINKNRLCGTYNFKAVGNAYVANISGLGFSASSPSGDKVFTNLPTVCVTIPNYNMKLAQSSVQFNTAWANTMNELMTYLNNTSGIINPTPWKLRELTLEFLTANLNYSAGLNSGVSIITGTCSGVPSSTAIYCK